MRDRYAKQCRKEFVSKRDWKFRQETMRKYENPNNQNPVDMEGSINDSVYEIFIQAVQKIKQAIHQNNTIELCNMVQELRTFISKDIENVPIVEIFKSNTAHLLVTLLSTDFIQYPSVIKNALWAFVNITNKCESSLLTSLQGYGLITNMINLFDNLDEDWLHKIVYITGNYVGDSLDYRNSFLENGLIHKIYESSRIFMKNYELQSAVVWFYTSLLRGEPFPKLDFSVMILREVLEINKCFRSEEVIQECVWAISYFLSSKEDVDERIWSVVNYDCVSKLLKESILSNKPGLIKPSLRVLGFISGGLPEQTGVFFDKPMINVSIFSPPFQILEDIKR